MLFGGVLDPFLDLKGIKIFFFTNIYVYNYFLGQTKPFATSNRDRLDTPKINLNVHWWLQTSPGGCLLCPQHEWSETGYLCLSWPGSRGRDRHQRRRLVLVTRCLPWC